ncbi:lantibiotic dehydratase [Kitasatospora sp. NPDC086791]|uniref:lantibiotic dehydratase n=1 Tax=Kitasatospora sp. NPDC086791 TaxID=3155178 RepID=UPI0034304C0B
MTDQATQEETGQRAQWQLYDRLLLRRAGFGIDLLTALGDGPAGAAAAEYREAVARFEQGRTRLLEAIAESVTGTDRERDRAGLRELSKLRGRVGRRLPVEHDPHATDGTPGTPGPDGTNGTRRGDLAAAIDGYRAAHAARQQVGERLTAALGEEVLRRPERVRDLLRDERVCDALLQLSPSFHTEAVRWADGWQQQDSAAGRNRAKDRSFYRRVYLYGQRLGAKNETTSYFGPLVHGRIDRAAEGTALGPETASGYHVLAAQTAFWAVCELAKLIGTDPQVRDRPPVAWLPSCRRTPGGTPGSGTIQSADGRRIPLSGVRWQLAEAVDGRRSTAELAALAGLDLAQTRRVLDRLRQAGAVRLWPEPPSTAARPLDWLLAWADRYAQDTAWPARLRELRDLGDAYAAAEGHRNRAVALERVEECFTRLTEADARRAGGRMYADRLVVSLDAKGDQSPVVIGGDVAGRWESELSPVLDLAARYGELQQHAAAELCTEIMRAAGGDAMPYDELIRRMRDAVEAGALDRLAGPLIAFKRDYAALVESAVRGQEARLSPAELAEFAPEPGRHRFVSPDLMLESRADGSELLVLGELHPYVFAWGSQGLFSDEQDRMLSDFEAGLEPWGGPERLATVIRRRRHKGLVADWFPGRFIEITSVATDDRERTVPLTDLTVVLVDGTPRLRTPDGELTLYAGEDDHVHLRAFAAPGVGLPLVRIGDFAPRITVGDLLVQRARWWFDRADLGVDAARDPAAAFLAVQSLRARHGVPRFCFASLPHEPKPVGIDLDSPLAVDALVAMVLAGDSATVSLAEMRPAPDALWLRHGGAPVTSEFRIAMKKASS